MAGVRTRLEDALARTDADADAALKAAAAAVRSLKKFRAAAHTGDLRELRKTIETAGQAIATLDQQFATARAGWAFDEEAYLSSRAFPEEVMAAAVQAGVKIFEQDDRLYCYPHLIRVSPADGVILIDKTRERRLRPSFLASHLKALQNKPVRFRPEAFLESLWAAYDTAVRTRKAAHAGTSASVPLLEIYDLLTLLPGASRDYSRQEFARDIYLLDQSGVTRTKRGARVAFPASTGTKSPGKSITVITKDGREKRYYGIAFASA